MSEIRASTVLPARREPVTLHTADGLDLGGELARPATGDPVARLVCLPPLPTQGGMMDSHILRKAANRLPALADIAVFRFNTRGTASDPGRSPGGFGDGQAEPYRGVGPAPAGPGPVRGRRPSPGAGGGAVLGSGLSAGRSAPSWC